MEKNRISALEVIGVAVVAIIVTPIIVNGMLIIGGSIYNKFQPKIYELTVYYSDGTTKVIRGTKKELKKMIDEQKIEAE